MLLSVLYAFLTSTVLADPDPYNIKVGVSSYLGSSSQNNTPTDVEVDDKGTIWVVGFGPFNYNLKPADLMPNATDGFVLALSNGNQPKQLSRIGSVVNHIKVSREGLLISGDFGIAMLNTEATQIKWHVNTTNCSNSATNCRLALTSTGMAAVLVAVNRGSDYVVTVYDAQGKVTASNEFAKGGHFWNDVAIDPENKLIFLTYFYETYLPTHLPVQVPCIQAWDYELKKEKWKDYCWSGKDMTGNEADSRGEYLLHNEKEGMLYFSGIAYGGNTCFRYQGQNLKKQIEMVGYDAYTQAYNMRSEGITFIGRIEPKTGNVSLGQIILSREDDGKGNSATPTGIAVGEGGNVYVAQRASCCIDHRNNLTVNGVKVGAYGGDAAFLAVGPDFKSRVHWNVFTKQGSSVPVDVASGGNTVAFVATTTGEIITNDPIKGTGAKSGKVNGFIVVVNE